MRRAGSERCAGCREAAIPIIAGLGERIFKTIGLFARISLRSHSCRMRGGDPQDDDSGNAETVEAKLVIYRIDVNLGDVLIDGEDILGDGVKIAARHESICEPGGI